ncbi:hypothetical protein M8818_004873 [Zalaria obscura]|uniref:Uncharacterized protein n=1 Tax=Zalaria obscura TaxID=2024903 RepID=A0ACC3SA99_9PEZI
MAEEQNNTVPVEAQPVRSCSKRDARTISLNDPQTTASEPVTEPTTASTEAAERTGRTQSCFWPPTSCSAWMVNTALTRLDKEELEGAKTAKMSKALQEAYEIAKEDHDLDYFKKMLADYQQAAKEAEEERLQKEAEKEAAAAEKKEKAEKAKAEKATKKSRKSNAGLDGDEMDVDATPKSSKKRKKEADSEGEGKPKKTPKSIKLSAGKTPNGESAKKKSKKTVTKPKSEGEEDGPEAAEEITEAQKLERREKADEEFNFKKRSTELLDAWNAAIEGNAAPAESTPAATNGETKAESAAPAATEESANAEEKADETRDDSAEKELTKEPASAPVETTEPGNDAKGEADVTMTDAKEDKPAETEAAEKAAEAPASTTEETAAA